MDGSQLLACAFIVVFASAFLHDLIPTPPPKILGIDLGTTYSCIGIFNPKTKKVDIIPDEYGNSCIPSLISFQKTGEILVGYDARKESILNSNNTVFDVKRFIGRKMEDLRRENDLSMFPFQIKERNGHPVIEIELQNGIAEYKPQELSAIVLEKLKKQAEKHLNTKVERIVLAIPVEFEEEQTKATEEAAQIAGMSVARTIYEPTAASMAYGLHNKQNATNVLVFDFGGGTLDVSLLQIEDGVFSVFARAGDKFLGGEDFNHNLMNYFLNKLKEKAPNVHVDKKILQELRESTERLKIQLSTDDTVQFQIESIGFRETITRTLFEEINKDLFERMMSVVRKVLKESSISPKEVNEIALVGGSTRIPKVRNLLAEYFGKYPDTSINPEEAVAIGTGIQAGILSDTKGIPVAAVEF